MVFLHLDIVYLTVVYVCVCVFNYTYIHMHEHLSVHICTVVWRSEDNPEDPSCLLSQGLSLSWNFK